MGALLSIPLMAVPSMGTVLGFAASCCGAATCSAVCSACGKCGNRYAPDPFRARQTSVLTNDGVPAVSQPVSHMPSYSS